MSDIRLFQFSNYVRPKLKVNKARNWVLNGDKNKFYQYIIDRNNGSPTNASINNSYSDLIYGKGLAAKNASINLKDWTKLVTILKPEDLQAIIKDYQIFGECSFQIVKTKGKDLSSINHVPKNMVVPSMENDEGLIESYWFCKDWTNTYKNEPLEYDAYGSGSKDEIYVVKPYIVGAEYFGQPDYLSGLMYAEMEEEIANLNISSIRNGLSAGYIVNVPGGFNWESEQKNKLENQIKAKLSGSSSASNFIINFAGQDLEITVIPFPTNENVHKQWESLNDTSSQKILTAHRCTSPSIVGIVSSSGFSNTADEMDTAEAQLIKRVIQPKQNQILNALQEVLVDNGINLELYFRPLTDEVSTPVSMSSHTCLSNESIDFSEDEGILMLESLRGEIITDEWEIVDKREFSEENEDDESWATKLIKPLEVNLAVIKSNPSEKSYLDKSFYKVRYTYQEKYSSGKSRSFCRAMMSRTDKGVVYRKEDIDMASFQGINRSFGHNGQSYSLFKFKGGVYCGHFFQQELYRLKTKTDGSFVADKALSSSEEVDTIPKAYIPKGDSFQKAGTAPKDMERGGHHPNYKG